MKFKVGFIIDGETMFRMLAQFLPVENVTVEELGPVAPAPPQRIAKIVARSQPLRAPAPKRKRHPSNEVNLTAGINKIIMDLLLDGKPHRAVELKPLLAQAGYSPNAVASRLQALRDHGVVARMGDGTWKLTTEAYLAHVRERA